MLTYRKYLHKKPIQSFLLAARVWIFTSLVFGCGWLLYGVFCEPGMALWISLVAAVCAAVGSLPVLLVLSIGFLWMGNLPLAVNGKISRLVVISLVCTLPYGLIGSGFFTGSYKSNNYWADYLLYSLAVSGVLFSCSVVALLLTRKAIIQFFSPPAKQNYSLTQINLQMETEQQAYVFAKDNRPSNKTLVKGLITGALILIMMIPTIFVSNLVTEREKRQEEVVKEVTSKWASEQTIAGPYICIPYKIPVTGADNKPGTLSRYLLLLPENLNISGELFPEIRPRSIYKVLLYKSSLKTKGNFYFRIPKEIDPASLQLTDARICFGITDFKGMEEKLIINFDTSSYELSPGLPVHDIDTNGLSAPINLTAADIGKNIDFNVQLTIKGSRQLHFVPLSGNTSIALKSAWPNPSFDGNSLPGERKYDKDGFSAEWTINKASLPFGTILKDAPFDKSNYSFGVSMLQPADQYAKTTRSVKYAILFIGLTFSLFFIVELMQKKPFHPVQYVLVGLALVIFYTLLLSLSEFILFDRAYFIAALATLLLITLYAKSHFANWATASLFGGVLAGLYGFIFVLIRLEDTALLIGSIGLFLVLALVMFGSRKINWYDTNKVKNELASA